MNINTTNLPWPLDRRLINLLQQEIGAAEASTSSGVVVNFRDPDYSATTGGYHPVEISVAADGCVRYITDLALYGSPPHVELGKEIDFDFELGLFQHMGREFPILRGRELFQMWQDNFISYHQAGVFSVEVSSG